MIRIILIIFIAQFSFVSFSQKKTRICTPPRTTMIDSSKLDLSINITNTNINNLDSLQKSLSNTSKSTINEINTQNCISSCIILFIVLFVLIVWAVFLCYLSDNTNISKKEKKLIHYIFPSVLLLLFLFYLRCQDSKLLNLDAKWLLFAGVPMLLGLIVSGFLKTFKGFGLELEANLKNEKIERTLEKVFEENQVVSNFNNSTDKNEKNPFDFSDKQKYTTLSFDLSRGSEYYGVKETLAYIKNLRKLKYILILDNSKFIAIFPITELISDDTIAKLNQDNIIDNNLETFIQLINSKQLPQNVTLVKDTLKITDNAYEAYKLLKRGLAQSKILNKGTESLPVVDERNEFKGVITIQDISATIVNEIEKSFDF